MAKEVVEERDRIGVKIGYVEQMIEGMNVLWEMGLLHRDLKLENVLVKGGVVKICDFGLCRKLN